MADALLKRLIPRDPPTWAISATTFTPNGDRFLFAQGGGGTSGFGDFYIVTDWFEELKELVGN